MLTLEEQQRIVEENGGFVTFIALRYLYKGVELDDLIQAGRLGMLEAARRFKPERGVKFTTYAVWYIRRYIIKELRAEIQAAAAARHNQWAHPDPEPEWSKLDKALCKLSLEEQDLLAMTFGLWGCTEVPPDQIGQRRGVTSSRVRQLVREALQRVKRLLTRED